MYSYCNNNYNSNYSPYVNYYSSTSNYSNINSARVNSKGQYATNINVSENTNKNTYTTDHMYSDSHIHNTKEKDKETKIASFEDAALYNLGEGYNLKHWNPERPPVVLLGSVFDTGSLAIWIRDWSKHTFSKHSTMIEVVSSFTDSLLLFTDYIDRLCRYTKFIPVFAQDEMILDFIKSAKRIIAKLSHLVTQCSSVMIKGTNSKTKKLSSTSASKFINELFSDLRETSNRERILVNIELWCKRTKANCEDLLV